MLDELISFKISKSNYLLTRWLNYYLIPYNLSVSQFYGLYAVIKLGEKNNLNIKKLADILGISRSTMSKNIKNHWHKIITLCRNPEDKRNYLIKPTALGVKKFQESTKTILEKDSEIKKHIRNKNSLESELDILIKEFEMISNRIE